jgi:hypothetical protein
MSDDLPIIISEESQTPTVLFLSSTGTVQMQQYGVAGWGVAITKDFQPLGPTALADVPAQVVDDSVIVRPTLVSCEIQTWTSEAIARVRKFQPRIIKVNCAFSDATPKTIEAAAQSLADMGLIVLGTHWRDDNTQRLVYLNRIDYLSALQPPEWPRLSFVGLTDARQADAVIRIGRLHAGHEQRIAQLRISETLRGEHIARLEKALIAAQQSPHFKSPL